MAPFAASRGHTVGKAFKNTLNTMKTNILTPFVLAAALASGVGAKAAMTDDSTPASMPAAGAALPAPNQTVYVPRLPSAQELANAAAGQQGVAIDRIEQTASQVTVVYKLPNGQTNAVAYQLLPAAASAPTQTPGAPTQTLVTPTTPAPTVVYQTAPRAVYYSDPSPYYYSSDGYYPSYYWYPPVALSLGFGYGYFHGGFHGGFHHGGHRW